VSGPVRAARAGLKVLVAAGGTGGHVMPGLALARVVLEREPTATVTFAGTTRGIETRAVPEAGFQLDLLPILPLSRRLALESLLAPFAAVAGTVAAWRLLRRRRVDAVCGMGGYVTLPVAAAARLAGVPVVLHEQNAVPGLANRLAARLAERVAVGIAEAAEGLPAGRTVVTGNPVRPELARLERDALRGEALQAFGLAWQRRTLLAFGGSQGARHINQALVAATPHWPDPRGLQILHACGRRDEAMVRDAWAAAAPDARDLLVRVVPFVDRMDLAYAAADLALTRAGAITVAELTAAGVPAVMVPLPHAVGGHQAANARAVAAAGGAVVIDDAQLDGARLASTVAPLLGDLDVLAGMSAAMRGLAHPDAADQLASLVLAAARNRRQGLADRAARGQAPPANPAAQPFERSEEP
jgi:UDP-N-acetylglucosamine--N-acetylmuramyl-(pentapeptide) pyrophosphoryl-undecaprenol N-acetylglucosamine transferase